MPVPSERRELLKRWMDFVEQNAYMRLFQETRDSYLYCCTMVETLDSHRYLDRSFSGPTTYISVSDTKLIELIQPMNRSEFRECFRMSRTELRRLYDLVGNHPIFHNKLGRPQRHPIVQLSVFLYRLGSGNRLSDVQRTLGRLPRGSIVWYTLRSIVAITSVYKKAVVWPDSARRDEIATFLGDKYKLPRCVGFIDGSHILLHKTPSFSIEKNATFWSRKKRYGLLILAVCDHEKRFTFLQTGHFSSANDFRAQRSSSLVRRPHELFDAEQYILGDSGFFCTNEVVPMYRRQAGSRLNEMESDFNDHVAQARVKIEHAFGILKQRWMMLNDMHVLLKEQMNLSVAYAVIRAAVVLHNLFVDTSALHWDPSEFRAAKAEAEALQAKLEAAEAVDRRTPHDDRPARRKRVADRCLSFR